MADLYHTLPIPPMISSLGSMWDEWFAPHQAMKDNSPLNVTDAYIARPESDLTTRVWLSHRGQEAEDA
jgi:hypothetical protein